MVSRQKSSTIDNEQTLAAIWHPGVHMMCYKQPGDRGMSSIGHNDPSALLDEARYMSERGHEVWWGVNPLTKIPTSGRGRADDVESAGVLWADFDWQDDTAHKSEKLPTETEVRASIRKLRWKPTVTINSGHGLQCYWKLEEPLATRLVSGVQKLFSEELQKTGLPRNDRTDAASVMRVPGTWNLKAVPVLVTVEELEHTRTYRFDAAITAVEQQLQRKIITFDEELEQMVQSGGGSINGLVGAVFMAPEGNRNHVLNWAAHRLGLDVRAGKIEDPQTALEWLRRAGEASGLDDSEIGPTLRSGYESGASGMTLPGFKP